MKRVLVIILMIFSLFIQPIYALEVDELTAMSTLELLQDDLEKFYQGNDYVFYDENGDDMTDIVQSYKYNFYQDQLSVSSLLLDKISSYGEISNIISEDINGAQRFASYTWKNYRIKVIDSSIIIVNVYVSAYYNTSSKKAESPTGKLTNERCVGTTSKISSYTVSTSYLNSGKTIHYIFNIKCSYISGTIKRSKTLKVTKNWTPSA